jgi:hypothetical protein
MTGAAGRVPRLNRRGWRRTRRRAKPVYVSCQFSQEGFVALFLELRLNGVSRLIGSGRRIRNYITTL